MDADTDTTGQEIPIKIKIGLNVTLSSISLVQGVPYHWAHFVFVIFSGSRAHTEELFIAIG